MIVFGVLVFFLYICYAHHQMKRQQAGLDACWEAYAALKKEISQLGDGSAPLSALPQPSPEAPLSEAEGASTTYEALPPSVDEEMQESVVTAAPVLREGEGKEEILTPEEAPMVQEEGSGQAPQATEEPKKDERPEPAGLSSDPSSTVETAAPSPLDVEETPEADVPGKEEEALAEVVSPTADLPPEDPSAADQPAVDTPPEGLAAASVSTPPAYANHPLFVWLSRTSAITKGGLLVLMVGIVLGLRELSKYASLPPEARLVLVAAVGAGMSVFGYLKRHQRRKTAEVLQGGGFAIQFVAVLFAVHWYDFIPQSTGFALLAALSAGAALMAVRQSSQQLFVITMLGGLAAPLVSGADEAAQWVPFTYYLLVNLAVLAVAKVRPWRWPSVIGIFFTFVVATLWGTLRYEQSQLLTTEPFLVAFFSMYLLGPIWLANDDKKENMAALHTLLFSPPFAMIIFQAALVGHTRWGMAITSSVMAATYFGLWRGLKAEKYAPHRSAYQGLFGVFAALTIPYLFESLVLTGLAWALQGAAISGYGRKTSHQLARWFGLGLALLGTGVAFAHSSDGGMELSTFLSQTLACLALWYVARQGVMKRDSASEDGADNGLTPLLTAVATGAALVPLYRFIEQSFETQQLAVFFVIAGLYLGLAELVGRRLDWFAARTVGFFTPILFVLAMLCWRGSLYTEGGWWAWPLLVMSLWYFWGQMGRGVGAFTRPVNGVILQIFAATFVGQLVYDYGGERMTVTGAAVLLVLAVTTLAVFPGRKSARIPLSQDPLQAVVWSVPLGVVLTGLWLLFESSAYFSMSGWRGILPVYNGMGLGPALTLIAVLWWQSTLTKEAPTSDRSEVLLLATPMMVLWSGHVETPIAGWQLAEHLLSALVLWVAAYRLRGRLAHSEASTWQRFVQPTRLLPMVATLLALGPIHQSILSSHLENPVAVFWLITAGLLMASELIGRKLDWFAARTVGFVTPLAFAVAALSWNGPLHSQGGLWLWPVFTACVLYFWGPIGRHVAPVTRRLTMVGLQLFGFFFLRDVLIGLAGWAEPTASGMAVTAMALSLVALLKFRRSEGWPPGEEPEVTLSTTIPVGFGLLGAWWLLFGAWLPGDVQALPFIPLLNAVELGPFIGLLCFWVWQRAMRSSQKSMWLADPRWLYGAALVLLNFSIGRTVADYTAIPFELGALFVSPIYQASATFFWTAMGILAAWRGSRTSDRAVWVAGAIMLGAVVVKLFLVDLQGTSILLKVGTFLGVGTLIMGAGWWAPPPSMKDEEEPRKIA